MTRDQTIALHVYTTAILRARNAYYAEPNACADWCKRCIRPRGSNRKCWQCRDIVRLRALSAARSAARRAT